MAEEQERTEKDDRIPMPVFTAGERFKESIYAIGDITLFRPISLAELLVGVPICALISYFIISPITSGTTAFAFFAVMMYMAPKAIVWLEAAAGRPLIKEAVATLTFMVSEITRQNIYQGVRQVSPYKDKHQHKRLRAMLAEEEEAHRELMAGRSNPGAD